MFLMISQVRTDLVLETGHVRLADSATFNVEPRVSDVRTRHHPLKVPNPTAGESCFHSHRRYNPHQCHHTCRAVQPKPLKPHVRQPCLEVSPSVRVIGNVVPKVADITILQRMCLVYVVGQAVLKLH